MLKQKFTALVLAMLATAMFARALAQTPVEARTAAVFPHEDMVQALTIRAAYIPKKN
jgi:succinate dehydrogenase hydrophobic anchor subunit